MYTHFFTRLSSLSQKNLLDSFTSFCSFSLFNFQGPACHPSRWQLFNYIIHISVCQQLFSTFYKFFQTSLCISLSLSEQLIYYTTDLGFVNPYFSYFKSFRGTVCITDSFYIIQLNCHFVNSFSWLFIFAQSRCVIYNTTILYNFYGNFLFFIVHYFLMGNITTLSSFHLSI